MSEYTTAECKEFLSEEFPYDEKKWKRVKKSKDPNGNTVREFAHPDSPQNVYVVEHQGDLQLSVSPFDKHFVPSSFVFSVYDDAQTKSLGGHALLIYFDHPDNEGGSGEYDYVVPGLFPQSWKVYEEMEDLFSIYSSGLSEEELIVVMHDMGFKSSEFFDKQMNGRSALTSPTILARNQKQVLTQAVQSDAVPDAKPSKI